MSTYTDLIAAREHTAPEYGFTPTYLPDYLFDFQRHLVDWAVRQGRSAILADCGMGKAPMGLVWAQNVHQHTGRRVLFLTPLAVSFQLEQEAGKFGIDAGRSRDGRPADAPVTITNYEQLEKFNRDDYAGVVCDESSAIKAFDGTRRALVTDFLRKMPYRLLCTATAAPNDYVELGTSSEALGHLGYMDMLARFFTNKMQNSAQRGFAGKANEWRFKGHAEDPFWQWVASWARAIRRPSDLGFDDGPFQLPPLDYREHIVTARSSAAGTLFDVPANGLAEEREETRRTLTERCETAAAVHENATGPGVAWCHLNHESALLTRLIDGAVEVAGSDPPESKEDKLVAFTRGDIRVLVTKPSLGAWGLNWQHCNRMTYFPSHSYEALYQAVRRSWRFGQTRPVTVDLITTEGGLNALRNVQRKAGQADRMFDVLVRHMTAATRIAKTTYEQPVEVPAWVS
jgi:hypothetical protein